jgi:tRNA A-37 threonylcarbamoyl transferase component Bud32
MKTMVSTACTGAPGTPEVPDVLVPGAKAGPWQVERELGRGGMGTVYAVVHEEIGKRAALKVVHQRLISSVNSERMLLEAKVVNQVGHPNIVDIFETGKLPDGRPYIVMERLCGQSLAIRAEEGKLLPDLVIAILLQICDALIAAHSAGVVHRDLKLDNVFLIDNPDDPPTPKVKLLDWGIAKIIHHDVRHTIDGQLVGTPQYLSPEQARGQAVSPETDVYSLGVMAYELFLEQLPFEAETAAEVMAMHLRATPPQPSELWPDIPPALEALLLAMLAKQPDQRPTMIEVARRLEAVREELLRRCCVAAPLRPATGPGTRAGRLESVPPVPPVIVRAPSRARMASSAGISATQPFGWRYESRRWQYAIGGLALALSGLLFWISRDHDHAASAATGPEVVAGAPLAVHAPGPGPQVAPATLRAASDRAVAIAAPPARVTAEAPAAGEITPVALAATPLVLHPAHPERAALPITRPAPRSPAPARRVPAEPRRGTRLDPDGTLDPYR